MRTFWGSRRDRWYRAAAISQDEDQVRQVDNYLLTEPGPPPGKAQFPDELIPRLRPWRVVAGRVQDDVWQNGQGTVHFVEPFPDGKQQFPDELIDRERPGRDIAARSVVEAGWGLPLVLTGQDRLYGDPGQVPTYDWQLPPRGRQYPTDLRSFFDVGVTDTLLGQDRFYGDPGQAITFDWQLPPRGRPYPVALRGYEDQGVADVLLGQDRVYGDPGQVPVYDWPNPRGRPYPVALRTHIDTGVTDTLAGQDRFYGDPGQAITFDWQLPPKGRPYPTELRGFLDWGNTDLLLGQDRLYGDPGQAPTYDWQLPPRAKARPLDIAPPLDLLGTTLAPSETPPEGQQRYPDFLLLPAQRGSHVAARARGETPPSLLATTLAGQDRIYGDPGQVPTYDWHVPSRGRPRPLDVAPVLDLLGTLLAPSEVPPEGQRDLEWWPDVLARRALRTALLGFDQNTLNTVLAAAPPAVVARLRTLLGVGT